MGSKGDSGGEGGNAGHHNHLPRPCEITGHLENQAMQLGTSQAHKTEHMQSILYFPYYSVLITC